MELFIKDRKRKDGENQFFMHQFVEAAISEGIKPVKELYFNIKGKRFVASITHKLLGNNNSDRCLIVTSQGGGILENSFPYYSQFKIIPMVWDIWPRSQTQFYKSLKSLKCPCVLVTVREIARRVESELGIPALWVPEGINIFDYTPGTLLKDRSIDVYELGRQMRSYHKIIKELQYDKNISYCGHDVDDDGNLLHLAFESAQDLLDNLPKMKIIISFPKVDTEPYCEHGGLETMTQRYWEAMLNRSLIVGRAPQELIDFIGYNPVVEIDWNAPKEQLWHILNNINEYQSIVDDNYKVALQKASWNSRMPEILKFIKSHINS